jgi:hypothetical protein
MWMDALDDSGGCLCSPSFSYITPVSLACLYFSTLFCRRGILECDYIQRLLFTELPALRIIRPLPLYNDLGCASGGPDHNFLPNVVCHLSDLRGVSFMMSRVL